MPAYPNWSRAECSDCGAVVKRNALKKDFTGREKCPDCFDRKHPMDKARERMKRAERV